jgi:hypothetical protein
MDAFVTDCHAAIDSAWDQHLAQFPNGHVKIPEKIRKLLEVR